MKSITKAEYQRKRRALKKAGLATHHEWKRPKPVRLFMAEYMRAYRARKRSEASKK